MPIKIVEEKPLSAVEKTYLPGVLAGLWVTFKRMWQKPVTLQYPEEKPAIPPGYRGVPTLVKDPAGRVKCVSCQLCEFVCPPKAIRITPGSIAPNADNAHVEKQPKEFEINMLRCIYCGLCEEVCPEEAIFLKDVYSTSGYSREEMVFKKEKLLEMGGIHDDKHRKWDKKLAAEKAAKMH
jgi:NADH-quinone oxidoreductase subunit I